LAAVEEHERGCACWLHNFLPEDFQRDLFSGDEDKSTLTLLDNVETLQYPLSVLQKDRRHALASPLLVDGARYWEMPPLESADQHLAPSQKLPTSKQLTLPAVPDSANPLSSVSIDPSSLSLNLLPIIPPSQTGDSNLVANKTINNNHKEKVPHQKARRHSLASLPLVASDEMTPLEPADRHPAPSQKLPTSKEPTPPAAPASAPPLSSASIALNPLFLNLFPINPTSQTGDSNLVANRTIDSNHKEVVPQHQGHSLLPLPVNGSGQPLLSQESTPSPTVQVLIAEDGGKAVLEGQNMPLQEIVPPLQHSFLPTPIYGSGQPLLSQESTSSFKVQVLIDGVGEEAVLEGHNMRLDMDSFRSRSCISRAGRYPSRLAELFIQWCWSISRLGIEWPLPVEDNGILRTTPSPRLPPSSPSSPSFPVRRSDAPPFFSPGRSDDGILPTPPSSTSPRSDDDILPTPPFYTSLPSTYSLRRSGSSPTRSGLPQKASSTPVPRSSPSTLGGHPLPFSHEFS